jgi:hypothetical protein
MRQNLLLKFDTITRKLHIERDEEKKKQSTQKQQSGPTVKREKRESGLEWTIKTMTPPGWVRSVVPKSTPFLQSSQRTSQLELRQRKEREDESGEEKKGGLGVTRYPEGKRTSFMS